MRTRAVLLVVSILLIAAFAALNWSEIIRPAPLLFGPVVMDAPLGLILLTLLALSVVAFALSAGAIRTQSLIESRHHFKELEAQRALADKAEASRFTDLRQHLDTQLRELRDRDAITATEFQKSVVESQRELRTQLEQINRTIAARMNELEQRLDQRFAGGAAMHTPVRNDTVHPDAVRPEHAQSRELRDAQLREDQLRQERIRAEQHAAEVRLQQERAHGEVRRDEKAIASDRPAESGWRRWF